MLRPRSEIIAALVIALLPFGVAGQNVTLPANSTTPAGNVTLQQVAYYLTGNANNISSSCVPANLLLVVATKLPVAACQTVTNCTQVAGTNNATVTFRTQCRTPLFTPPAAALATRDFVSMAFYEDSDKCQGDVPAVAKIYPADGSCYPDQPFGGESFFNASCKDGQPVVFQCTDSQCRNCTNLWKSGCQTLGSGSRNLVCVQAEKVSKPNGTDPSLPNFPSSNGNRVTDFSAPLLLSIVLAGLYVL